MDTLHQLIAATEKIADGELQARAQLPQDEGDLGRLAGAIDSMAAIMLAQRRHIEQITRQNRRSIHAHRILSASNRALLRATDEASQLREVCRLIVEVGNYPFAWIGYVEHDANKTIRPMAYFGMEGDFLHRLGLTWENRGFGTGATGIAIRTGKTTLIRDIAHDERSKPWREVARERGITSILALPLRIHGQVEGVLVVSAKDPEAFDDEEIKLLEETTGDLTFAIELLRAREQQRQTQEAYRRVSHQNALILQSAAEGIYGVDTSGVINFINPAAAAMFGYQMEELLGRNAHEMVHHSKPDGSPYPAAECPVIMAFAAGQPVKRAQETLWRKDGSSFPVELSSTPMLDNNKLIGAVVVLQDISDRARYMAQLERKSNFDDLTGLPNRNLLNDRLAQALDRCRQEKAMLALLVINLNQFRNIINSLGHSEGDVVLQNTARFLRNIALETDTLARTSGDEFVWLRQVAREDDAAVMAQEVLNALSQPMLAGTREVYVTASVGIAVFPKDGKDADTLLKNAASAMQRAKQSGDHRFNFYTLEMNARSLERLDMESALRRAIEKEDELVLHYQPQICLRSGSIVGCEALVRWRHPKRGLVSPAEFIPLAEATGLIVPLGEWVLRTACRQNQAWQRAGLPMIRIAVNMSARQVDAQEFPLLANRILDETGLSGCYLELELTESQVMSDPMAFVAATRKLKDVGVVLSIDDFGTGYSSLNHLNRFAIDRLKIDQSFVRGITYDPNAAAITLAILALAKSLKMATTAEGVETEAQLNFLRRRECDEMQGYLFSPAVPAGEFERFLRDSRKLAFPAIHNTPQNTLLLVDDDPATLAALQRLLQREGYTTLTAETGLEGLNLMAGNEVGVVISAARLSPLNGADFLGKVREMYPDTVRMMLSGQPAAPDIREAVNKGEIYQFLTAPWEDDKLLSAIQQAFRYYETQRLRKKT